jgi:hypothetical protein
VGKPEGKRPLGKTRRRWVDNIKMYLGDMKWGGVDWIGIGTSSLSSSAQLHRISKQYVRGRWC